MWYIFGKSHGEIPCIKYQLRVKVAHNTNQRYLSVVDWVQLEGGIIEFCCGVFSESLLVADGTCSVLSMPSIEVEIGAADTRHNKKASKITMQR